MGEEVKAAPPAAAELVEAVAEQQQEPATNGEQMVAESEVHEKPAEVEAPSDPVPAEASEPVEEASEEAGSPPASEEAPTEAAETPAAAVAGVRGRVPPGGHSSGPFW